MCTYQRLPIRESKGIRSFTYCSTTAAHLSCGHTNSKPSLHIYFPTDSLISLLNVLADGAPIEISVAGNDGAIGIALFMGGENTSCRAIVWSAGYAYRLTGRATQESVSSPR